MFWGRKKKPKVEESSVAFQLGEAIGRYTDTVIGQMKAKDEEIERLKQQLASRESNPA